MYWYIRILLLQIENLVKDYFLNPPKYRLLRCSNTARKIKRKKKKREKREKEKKRKGKKRKKEKKEKEKKEKKTSTRRAAPRPLQEGQGEEQSLARGPFLGRKAEVSRRRPASYSEEDAAH